MNLGKRYWKATLSNQNQYQTSLTSDYCSNLADNIKKGKGLILWGNNSSGKTYIASALCKSVWGNYRVASYMITSGELCEAMKKDFPAHEGSEESVVERIKRMLVSYYQ